MRVLARILMVLFCMGLALPVAADEFRGTRGTRVNQVDASVFEVVARSSSRGSDFWCGASEYARRVLGHGWSDIIYVVREMGPSVMTNRRSAVHFSMTLAGAAGDPPRAIRSSNRFRVGDSMSVQIANTYCTIQPIRM